MTVAEDRRWVLKISEPPTIVGDCRWFCRTEYTYSAIKLMHKSYISAVYQLQICIAYRTRTTVVNKTHAVPCSFSNATYRYDQICCLKVISCGTFLVAVENCFYFVFLCVSLHCVVGLCCFYFYMYLYCAAIWRNEERKRMNKISLIPFPLSRSDFPCNQFAAKYIVN